MKNEEKNQIDNNYAEVISTSDVESTDLSELELHTIRRMEDDIDFFKWQNDHEFQELYNEGILDFYIHLKMDEAQELFGSSK